MTIDKRALIGTHTRMTGSTLSMHLSNLGYRVEQVADVAQMVERCAQQDYDLYLMDANLGDRDAPTIEPAMQVHQALYARGHERRLEARLHTFSGNEETVDLAQARGLNAYLSSQLTRELIGQMVTGEQ